MALLPQKLDAFAEKLSSETARADRRVRAINAKTTGRVKSFEDHAAELERQVANYLAGDAPAEAVDIEAFRSWAKNGNGTVRKNGTTPDHAAPTGEVAPTDEVGV